MGRYDGSGGHYHSTRQKGRKRRNRTGTYARKHKSLYADIYLPAPPWIKKARQS